MGCQRIICETVAFADQVEIRLAGLEKHFDLPYADILEMPINLWQNPVPGVTPDTGNNYRHLFQSAQALYNIFIVSIFESDVILKDRTITIA
jgi:hypothetical protein